MFVTALCVRLLAPRVPSNFYSDLPSAFPTYQYNIHYHNPLYDLLARQTALAEAPIDVNIVLGALACSCVFLALDGIEGAPALLTAFAIAVLPVYVRMSATDAPHVYGLFLFCLVS